MSHAPPTRWRDRLAFVLANVLVMIVLHGNSRQFWPKIPFLSLRNEGVAEHSRLLFNTLALVTVAQVGLGRLPRSRRMPRMVALVALPLALPALIFFGQHVLRLRDRAAETYHLALVPLLPVAALALEEALAAQT